MANNPVKLFAQSGYYLAVNTDGDVYGAEDDTDIYSHLLITSCAAGCVRIQGIHNQLYLCFDAEGYLYGAADRDETGTIFLEAPAEESDVYLNYKSPDNDWYISIRRDGCVRKGPNSRKITSQRLQEKQFLQQKL